MVDPIWGEEQDGGAPFCRFLPIWGEGQDGGAPFCRFLPIWDEGGQDGGLPSWQSLFGVENKMAVLPSGGFYLFGVEDVMMEAHHHGGADLG